MAIREFKSKKLERYFKRGDVSGLQSGHDVIVGDILDAIASSHHPRDLKALFHNEFYSEDSSDVTVYSVEVLHFWRVSFQVHDDGAVLLDYRDHA